MKLRHAYILAFLTALLLTSCSASQSASRSAELTDQSAAEVVNARIALSITNSDLSSTGRLRMVRDEVIQLNLVFVGMNIGTLELTQDSVLYLDRINKRYFHAPYQEIRALSERGITFKTMQGLFWGDNIMGYDDDLTSWHYTAVGRVNGHKIPSMHEARFHTEKSEAGFDLKLSEITNNAKWPRRTSFDKDKFLRCEPNGLFNALLSM